MNRTPTMKYDGFLSYSHAADGQLAPAVQSGLHRLACPWYRLRSVRIFRDKTTLSATPSLWPKIEEALADSRYFLLMASPEAAASTWVGREVEWWLAHRSPDAMLIVLTEGDLSWNSSENDFDWSATTALPQLLQRRFSSEPLWVDLRWARSEEKLSLRHSQFRSAILDLAATLIGRSKDSLDGDDVRVYRRNRTLAGTSLGLILGLALVSIFAGVRAIQARDEAIRQRNQALADNLASQSETVGGQQLDLALLLAVQANRFSVSNPSLARGHLLELLSVSPAIQNYLDSQSDEVNDVVMSPSGDWLIAGGDDGAIEVWDTAQRKLIGAVRNHHEGVNRIALAGTLLVSGGKDGRIILWDGLPHLHLRKILNDGGTVVFSVAFSPDGRWVAAGDIEGNIRFWDVQSGLEHSDRTIRTGNAVRAVEFTPRGNVLASGQDNHSVVLWDFASGKPIGKPLVGPSESIYRIAFSPDGKLLASGDYDGMIFVWNVQQKQKLFRLSRHSGTVFGLSFSRDGKTLASSGFDRTVILWDLTRNPPIARILRGHSDRVFGVSFNRSNDLLISGGGKHQLVLWNIGAATPLIHELPGGHKLSVRRLVFSPDGNFLASASLDRTIVLWGVKKRAQLVPSLTGHKDGILALDFSPDGKLLASGSSDATVIIWDVLQHHAIDPPLQHSNQVLSIKFSPDGKTLASGDMDGNVTLWDVQSHRVVRTIKVTPGWVKAIAFNRTGEVLASGDTAGKLSFWNLLKGDQIGTTWQAHTSDINGLSVSPNGRLLASAGADRTIRFWDFEAHTPFGEPLLAESSENQVYDVAFSRDGNYLAASGEAEVTLWDVTARQRIGQPIQGLGTTIAFSPREDILAFAYSNHTFWVPLDSGANRVAKTQPITSHEDTATDTDDRTFPVSLFEVGVEYWKEYACRIANRNLTADEWQRFVSRDIPYQSTCPSLPSSGNSSK